MHIPLSYTGILECVNSARWSVTSREKAGEAEQAMWVSSATGSRSASEAPMATSRQPRSQARGARDLGGETRFPDGVIIIACLTNDIASWRSESGDLHRESIRAVSCRSGGRRGSVRVAARRAITFAQPDARDGRDGGVRRTAATRVGIGRRGGLFLQEMAHLRCRENANTLKLSRFWWSDQF